MEAIYTLASLEQIKALTEPLRLRILQVLAERPATTKQVAQVLGEKPTRLYHHVEALESAGLIRLVKTRQNRGTVEKYYEPIARDFAVSRALYEVRPPTEEALQTLQVVLASALEATLAEMRQSIAARLIRPEDPERVLLFTQSRVRATQAQIEALRARLAAMIKEIEDDAQQGDVHYGLTIAFYPIQQQAMTKRRRT